MNTFSRLAVLGAILSASASFALADTLSLGSFATGTTGTSLGFSSSQTAMNFAGYNALASSPTIGVTPTLLNGTASTFTLQPNGVWGTPSGNSTWIGVANGGPGGSSNPGYGYYQFTTQFVALGGSYNGAMSLMADDNAEVLLNGTVILPFTSLGGDSHCGDTGVTCQASNVIQLNNLNMLAGDNMFTFVVVQAGTLGTGQDPSGLNFTTVLARATAPEPSGLLLFGTGLLGIAPILFRKREQIAATI